MRKLTSIILIGLLVFLMSSLVFADYRDFSGRWTNVDPNTRGITALEINTDQAQINVRAWGKAHPSDIDWGLVSAYAYTGSVEENPVQGARTISAIFQTNFSETLLIIKPQGAELQVESFTRFTDRSGRSNYQALYRFRRDFKPWPGQPGSPGQGPQWPQGPQGPQGPQWPQGLATPQQISPASGSVFNNYPRRTTLRWASVPGAKSYCVEIDYYDYSWITDQGKTYIITPNLNKTSYTFNFVGAQPGRWRVWAVNAIGQQSQKSSWWEFKYTR